MRSPKLFLDALFSINYWQYTFLHKATISAIWTGITTALSASTALIRFLGVSDSQFRSYWWVGVIFVILWTLWSRPPILSICEKLPGRDVEVEIKVGDIFTEPGAKVISLNTTFDTDVDQSIISEASLQGKMTRQFYNSVQELDNEISPQLANLTPVETLTSKQKGKQTRYELGTVVQVRPKGELFYLVAIADMNNQGVAESSFEKIQYCLQQTWKYIGESGEAEPVVMPLIGSGRARITTNRITISQAIIRSFIESCASKKCCEKFTLVISPKDYRKYDLNLYELRDFLRYICKYEKIEQPVLGEIKDYGESKLPVKSATTS